MTPAPGTRHQRTTAKLSGKADLVSDALPGLSLRLDEVFPG